MTQSVNHGGDCRTAPATPALLNIEVVIIFHMSHYIALHCIGNLCGFIGYKVIPVTVQGYFWLIIHLLSVFLAPIGVQSAWGTNKSG